MINRKFYCYISQKQTKATDEAAKIRYKNVKFLNSLEEAMNIARNGDTVIFQDLFDLDANNTEDVSEILEVFREFRSNDVAIQFEKSPECDTETIEFAVLELVNNELIEAPIDKAYDVMFSIMAQEYINHRLISVNIRKSMNVAVNRVDGKSLGRPKGTKRESAKAKRAKKIILTESKTFGGSLTDTECIKKCGVSKNQYYIYKKELLNKEKEK